MIQQSIAPKPKYVGCAITKHELHLRRTYQETRTLHLTEGPLHPVLWDHRQAVHFDRGRYQTSLWGPLTSGHIGRPTLVHRTIPQSCRTERIVFLGLSRDSVYEKVGVQIEKTQGHWYCYSCITVSTKSRLNPKNGRLFSVIMIPKVACWKTRFVPSNSHGLMCSYMIMVLFPFHHATFCFRRCLDLHPGSGLHSWNSFLISTWEWCLKFNVLLGS